MSTEIHAPAVGLELGPADEGRILTSEEFANAIFAEPYRYERIDGRLVVVLPAGHVHNRNSRPWRLRLNEFWIGHPDLVEDVVSECWLRIDGRNDRIGDIGVYLVKVEEPPPIPDRVPDLVIEVVTPDRKSRERDYVRKRADYYRFGIPEYVISDRKAKKVTVLRLAEGGYAETVLAAGDVYTTPLLPGLEIPVAEVL